MVDFLLRNWIGIFFIVAMLGMHLGGHRHAGRGGQGGLTGGCGARYGSRTDGSYTREQSPHTVERRSEDGRTGASHDLPERLPDPSRDAVPDPARDADPAWWGSTSPDNRLPRTSPPPDNPARQ